MLIEKKECVVYTSIYLLLLDIYIVYCIAASSYLGNIIFIPMPLLEKFCRYVVPVILVISYVCTAIKRHLQIKKLWLSAIIVVLLFFQMRYVKISGFINSILFMITYPFEIEPKKMAKYICPVYLATILYIIICCLLGFVENYTKFRFGTNNLRMAIGFVSANALANTVASMCMIYAYYKVDNWKKIDIVLFSTIALGVYLITYSRYAVLIIVCVAFICTFYKKLCKNKFAEKIYSLTSYLFPALFGLCYLVTILLKNKVESSMYIIINKIFSTRLQWMIYYYKKYGFSLLGQEIERVGIREAVENGTKWRGLDNSYMLFPIHYGIISLVMLAVGFFILGKRLKKKKDLLGALMCIILMLQGITENYMLSIQYNFMMLLFGYEFFSCKLRNKDNLISRNGMLGEQRSDG